MRKKKVEKEKKREKEDKEERVLWDASCKDAPSYRHGPNKQSLRAHYPIIPLARTEQQRRRQQSS